MRAFWLALSLLGAGAAPGRCQTTPRPLTLRECVRLALEKSPDLALARARLDEAGARLGKAYAPFSPQGTLTAEHTRFGYDPNTGAKNLGGRWDAETRSATLGLSWNLFDGLRDLDALSGARYDVGSASEAVVAARRQVVVDTVKAYFGILLGDRSIGAQEEDLRSKRQHLELAQARFKAGVRSYSDVLNSQIQLKQSEIGLIGERSSREAAVQALDILLDRPLTAETTVADELAYEPAREDLAADVAAALAGRPEVRAARAAVSSAEAGRRLALHELWPLLTLDGSWSYTVAGVPPTAVADGRLETLNPDWRLGLGLSFPFWDGGTRWGELRRARAALDAADQELARQERAVESDVSSAYLGLDKSQQVYGVAQGEVQAAREDLDIVTQRYKDGTASILDVVDAQDNLLRLQLDAVQALYDFRIARFELRRAVGLDPLGEETP